MFSLIIALLGGLFYGLVRLSDNLDATASYARDVKRLRDRNEFEKIVDVTGCPYEESEMLADPKYFEAVYEELKDDIRFIFGEEADVKEKLELPIKDAMYCWELQLLLSHRAKVFTYYASFGYRCCIILGLTEVDEYLRFCQRIEQNLRDATGTNITLYAQPAYVDNPNIPYDYRHPDRNKMISYDPRKCEIRFEHAIVDKNRAKRMW